MLKPDENNIEPNRVWLMTVLLGVTLSLSGLLMMPVFPSTSFVSTQGYGGPVFAFETARTSADLIDVFGPLHDPERANRISMMNAGNRLDFGFMLIYAVFMAGFFYAAFLTKKNRIYLGLSAIALASGGMDAIENIILLEITSDLDKALGLGVLAFPVWAKFFSIMTCIAAAGIFMFFESTTRCWRLAGVITVLSSSTILMAFIAPQSLGWLIQHGVTIGWLFMLAYAAKKSIWQTLSRFLK